MKTIILGPPGTGKTTALLELVESYLAKGVSPSKIGYFAFTKKAADTALQRAMKLFNLSEDDLPYFRTLHSLAFRRLGINTNQVMKKFNYQFIGRKLGFAVNYASYEDDNGGYFSSTSEYLNLIGVAKVKRISIEEQYDLNEHSGDIERNKLIIIANEIENYKRQLGLIDYSDMISKFTQKDLSPTFEVVFIDEAQDLSFLQWQMVKSIWNKSKEVYLAGDDDQAIFRWAGADLNYFINLKGNIKILDKSHRVPSGDIHNLAMRLVNRIIKRRPKLWKPKAKKGILRYHTDIEQVDMSSGNWLVLTRTNYQLEPIKDLCEQRGWYYTCKGDKGINEETFTAIYDWEKWRKGAPLVYNEIKNIYTHMTVKGKKLKRNYKNCKTLSKEKDYFLQDCMRDHGLLTNDVWYKALDDIDRNRKEYIRAMRRHGEQLQKNPRIRLSTIHGVKGGESDKVVLLTDLTQNTMENFVKNPDDENRLYYVGATRAKEELHIIEPKSNDMAYPI